VSVLIASQNREYEKSISSMRHLGLVALAAMFFIIALIFRDMGQTVIVFLLIPFSLVGVVGGHWLMDAPLSLFSFLGVIALIGVLVNDALVLVSAYNDLLRTGHGQMEALYEAGISRFRPVSLTSLTTFAGLAPIMFEKSLQAQPMAISVSHGLLVTTLVNLVLLPALLVILNRLRLLSSYLRFGYTPVKELAELARKEMEAEREMQNRLINN
jgi:multidrug efflux pump subunit AcrB